MDGPNSPSPLTPHPQTDAPTPPRNQISYQSDFLIDAPPCAELESLKDAIHGRCVCRNGSLRKSA